MEKPDPIEAVIIDLSGVLYLDGKALPGSVEALDRLQASGLPHCFLTNTTRQTREALQQQLLELGFDIPCQQLLTAGTAAHQYVVHNQLRPHLLIHPDLEAEFSDINCHSPNCVVVGDAGDAFTYASLNAAFRILSQHPEAPLISMGSNRYFKEADGLSLDMGPFVAALEYAAERKAIVTGKPADTFFQMALDQMGVTARQTCMIGDDLENDIGGAQSLGIAGILVRTGKYRPGDENHEHITASKVTHDFACAIDWILAQ